ncbi:MAG: hypothetical protein ACK5LL_09945 [Suipraeoptans sp.]
MADLTFAEQVKIILKRRNMTIKALADLVEKETGNNMSRQNMTQKLGRNNFQEQDMQLIASILGCSYKLDILGAETEAEPVKVDNIPNRNKLNKHKEGLAIEVSEGSTDSDEHIRDITVGELADINEEVDKLLAESDIEKEKTSQPVIKEEIKREVKRELKEEVKEEVITDTKEEIPSHEDIETLLHEVEVEDEEINTKARERREEKREERHAGKGVFRNFFSSFAKKQEEPEDVKGVRELSAEPSKDYDNSEEESSSEEAREPYTEESTNTTQESYAEEHTEQVYENEYDNEPGEPDINPYTGLEYETNSVRVHPNKIGYIQVYDRTMHKWTEMTEWAFLGYQERQKLLLGKAYKEPTYLD